MINEYVIIRNNKAPVKLVFEYMEIDELRAPALTRKMMLSEICDGIEFIEAKTNREAILKLNKGDYLFAEDHKRNGLLKLISANK